MSSAGFFSMPLTWLFFLFVSFWPWEKDTAEIKKTSLEVPTSPELVKVVRIALFYEKSQVVVGAPARYQMEGVPGNEPLTQGSFLSSTAVRPDPGGIRVGGALYPVSGLRISSDAKEVQVEEKKYHNAVQLLKNPAGSLTVINEVDVEDYLLGVLPGEVNPEWPEEALKAQAVASRTYAIFKNIENKDFPFTLSADVGSQVYGGKTIERPSSNRAVERTRGEILTYRGKIFPAFFHSTCGGRTARADYQWKVESHPSLKGAECTFCRGSKFYGWKAEFSAAEIEKALRKKGYPISGLRDLHPAEPDVSGRAHFMVVQHDPGSLTLSANEFRLALGPNRMRSTRMKVKRNGDHFVFEGRGWGHGVGMCQFGAKRLAEIGYRYNDILRYYYPESEIRNLEDFLAPGLEQVPAEEGAKDNLFQGWYEKVKNYVEDL